MTLDLLRKKLRSTKARDLFTKLYGHDPQVVERQITRYIRAAERFCELFPRLNSEDFFVFSAPGRTEIGGNHTDHNAGRVLAAGVSLMLLFVTRSSDNVITVYSEGYPRPL